VKQKYIKNKTINHYVAVFSLYCLPYKASKPHMHSTVKLLLS